MEDFFRNIKAGDEGTILQLLEADPALLEARDEMLNLTPLAMAASRGLPGLMRLLIQMGADVNALGFIGRTPLHYAALRRDNEESVALLLTHGAQKTIRDQMHWTPFMMACLRGHLGSVRLLVHHMGGQGLDDKDLDGHTALHLASERGRKEVVTFLLLSGADPTILNNKGKTPRQWAQEYDGRDGDAEGRKRCIARLKVSYLYYAERHIAVYSFLWTRHEQLTTTRGRDQVYEKGLTRAVLRPSLVDAYGRGRKANTSVATCSLEPRACTRPT